MSEFRDFLNEQLQDPEVKKNMMLWKQSIL